jgi:hypothetical protein
MEEKQVMNIYQKLQKCRVELQRAIIKMSGKNTFSNYEYFELSDFLPQINEIADKHNIATIFQYTNEEATLIIVNTENIEEKLTWSTPVEVTQLKGCNTMQNIGGTQTFARRYLYTMAFEISEPDILNNGEKDEEAELKRKKIDPIKVKIIKDLLKETGADEAGFLKYYKIKSVEDITNGNFNICLRALEDKKTKKQPVDLPI